MKNFIFSIFLFVSAFLMPTLASAQESELVGNPQVEVSITRYDKDFIKCKFVPNIDTKVFYIFIIEAGDIDNTLNTVGKMFGLNTYEDMFKAWGKPMNAAGYHTFEELTPDTEYEIYVQPLDMNDNFAPYSMLKASTKGQGGDGPSVITIEILEWDDEGSQRVRFTPNDMTARFYDVLITQAGYEELGGAAGMKQYLMENEENPEWKKRYAMYGVDDDKWGLNPATKYHACAMGLNATAVWGEMADVTFTTPGYAEGIETVNAGKASANAAIYDVRGMKVSETKSGELYIRQGRVFIKK